MTEIVRLRHASRELHGLESEHVRSEPVHETFQGETVWRGTVEVFHVFGRQAATVAHASAHETDEGGRRHVAVPGVPSINTALDAVRAAVVAELKGRPP